MPLPIKYLEKDSVLIQSLYLKNFPDNFTYIPENTFALTDKNLNIDLIKKYSGRKYESKKCECKVSQIFTDDFKQLTQEGYQYVVTSGYEQPLTRCDDKRCKLRLDKYYESRKDRRLEIFFKNNTIGWGLRTLEFIPKYSFIGEYVGWYEDSNALIEPSAYIFQFGYTEYNIISDARRFGNYTRFANHSCNPNVLTIEANNMDWCSFTEDLDKKNKRKIKYKYIPQIWFIADRDIYPGEELYINYGTAYFSNVDYNCLCGEDNCMIYKNKK
ncbi:G9a [Strongyloides ratti]|uniref:G9a n=1 Tax=Strongyloides ratti TaxID=34506 RepID=A0A090MVV4_STRRB|nr:G9a [Strongyloides ratti]CEF63143.1 G9a [Strongyloides ratti]